MKGIKKGIVGLAAVALAGSVSFADSYPSYPKTSPAKHYRSQIGKNTQRVLGSCTNVNIGDVEQSLYVNIPAYYARLDTTHGNTLCSSHTFSIRVGRNYKWHSNKKGSRKMRTPEGVGKVTQKMVAVSFTREKQNELTGEKFTEKIMFSNTYTPQGKRIRIPMPYKWIRGLGVEMPVSYRKRPKTGCIFHATTDEHTIGTPASHCCIGLTLDDMLDLYGLVQPEQRKGKLSKPITLTVDYDVVEKQGTDIILHADIYRKGIDYVAEVKKELGTLWWIDESKLNAEVAKAQQSMEAGYTKIRRKLNKDKFISRDDVKQLHYTIKSENLISDNTHAWLQEMSHRLHRH